jgi:hypothetical protein
MYSDPISRRIAPVVLAFLALLAACGGAGPLPALRIPGLGGGREVSAVLAEAARRERETESLKVSFKVTLRRADGPTESSRGAVAVRPPDRLRLQIFSLGVMTVYDYTANGERYRVRMPLEGRTEVGRFDELAAAKSDLLRYDLRPLFLGRTGLEDAEAAVEGEVVVATLRTGPAWRRVTLARTDAAVLAEEWGTGDESLLRASYADHRWVEDAPLPYRIEVESPPSGVTLEIDITELERNAPLRDAMFDF